MATYFLDAFQFVLLEGLDPPGAPPDTVLRTSVPVQRPGVDGTGFILTGVKAAQQFRMRSLVDVLTRAQAQTLIQSYRDLVNKELVRIIHASADYSAGPIHNQYWVMDVQPTWRRVGAAAGGLNGGSYVVQAIWTLVPVHVPPAEEE